jgi:dTDP-4-dehydrorhamnose reductase
MRGTTEVILGIHRMERLLAATQPIRFDLDSSAQFLALLKEMRPAVVVHAAGSASVDECEINPSGAYRDNVQLAINVARAARQASVALIHISTDHLFSGNQSWLKENSQPGPLNVYGATKLEAEQLVRAEHPGTLIVRTNFFGWAPAGRRSISDWIIQGLRTGHTLDLFEDVFFTPILIEELARSAHELLAKGASGIVNLSGDERVSKYDFGIRLAEHFGLRTDLIRRSTLARAKLVAPRPLEMSLDNGYASELLGRRLGKLDTFFSRLKAQEAEHDR